MNVRAVPSVILFAGAVATAFGCSNSTTAPTQVKPAAAATSPATTAATTSPSRFSGRGTPGVIFVTSQGLYYDTFVVQDPLPMEGKFQLLTNGQTEFGPGQPGYLGGRWWEDLNGNGIQDAGDHFFLCPLLPPGRTTP